MTNYKVSIACLQADIAWESPELNREKYEVLIQSTDVDIFILPEMFTTGFSMDSEKIAEKYDGDSFKWMLEVASKTDTAIVGSIAVRQDGEYYNRLYWVNPDGKTHTYDKRHLFRMANEHTKYSAGNETIVIEYKGVRFKPFICYDLRFPVWSRSVNDCDCLIYVANWPGVRRSAWEALLKARAIENLSYCVGVNRVGVDGNGIEYSGGSYAFDYKGEIVSRCADNKESVMKFELDLNALKEFRLKFPAHMDADQFSLE